MSDSYQPNVDAYFTRIGYCGSQTVCLDTLHDITRHHAAAIPFENIDVLFGRGIDISSSAVERKLVDQARGGYCFEQNQLLLDVLKTMGFKANPLSGRVRWLLPREVIPPRTHLFIHVEIDGESWLTDVGVGACSLTAAVRWKNGLIQQTPHDHRQIIHENGCWFHQIRFDTDWLDVCEFTGEQMPTVDRQIANWWTSTHPDSKFRKNLIVSCTSHDGSRRSILNREFTLRRPNAMAEKYEIKSHAELLALLSKEFDLDLPVSGENLWAKFG